ncbi:ABC transporter permease [Butyrivibrio sp. JL13D10]|uniref:ABC transporter permease n=1 Tax=Butyrivibrio sp. JL13D10 TaxID=3236815 RepID=UPI0038B4D570
MNKDKIWNRILIIGIILMMVGAIIYFVVGRTELISINYTIGSYYSWFFTVFFVVLAIFIFFCIYNSNAEKQNKKTAVTECIHIFFDYKFLLKQLITRDFAVKYRRSYLGIVWVILNPLMQMIILSSIFSFVFRSNIDNFPVYLILGQVVYNFFNEATTVALGTMVTSGQLIKKIYMPKYIFPISKTIFSFINFLISFIPVMMVMLFFGVYPNIYWIYLPLYFVTLFAFTLGIGLLLAAMDVFMRDTQYLYGILLPLLNFLTPIFYPVTALSPLIQKIMWWNPLFQYVDCIRHIMLYNTAPSIQQMAMCLLYGFGFLFIGMSYFYRRQDRFILYI